MSKFKKLKRIPDHLKDIVAALRSSPDITAVMPQSLPPEVIADGFTLRRKKDHLEKKYFSLTVKGKRKTIKTEKLPLDFYSKFSDHFNGGTI